MMKYNKNQVEEILQEHPEARNNDFLLFWLWLQRFGGLTLPNLTENQFKE